MARKLNLNKHISIISELRLKFIGETGPEPRKPESMSAVIFGDNHRFFQFQSNTIVCCQDLKQTIYTDCFDFTGGVRPITLTVFSISTDNRAVRMKTILFYTPQKR